MNYTRNKLMAWFLTLTMILTMLPVLALPAVAEGTSVDFSGGSDYTGEDGFDDGFGDVLSIPTLDEQVPGEPNYATSVIVGGVDMKESVTNTTSMSTTMKMRAESIASMMCARR